MSEDDKKVYEKMSTSMEVLAKSVNNFNSTIVSLTEKRVKQNSKDDEKSSGAGKVIQFTLITGATIVGLVIVVKGVKMLIRKASDR